MTNGNRSVFEFDDVRVEASELRIWKAGTELALEPKTFQVLLFLLENRGRLIGKAELLDVVWKDAFVTENAMAQEISKLRKELGDDSKTPKYIQTAHTQGYRFIAETVETKVRDAKTIADLASHQPNATLTKSTGSRFLSLPPYAAFALTALLVSSIGLVYYFFYAGKASSSADGKKTIAVLPLKPINTANRDQLYEIGIADSLTQRLGLMKGLIVRPLSATRKYDDIDQNARTAGTEQQVDYVLSSTYQLADGKIRITAQLLNVATGQTEQTYTLEKDASNVFAMQDAIAADLGNKLSARFGGTANDSAAAGRTTNEEAYRLYLQGLYLVDKVEPADARKAVEIFGQAVALDPNYAQAWAGKAKAHRKVASLGRSVNIDEQHQLSMAAIEKALAVNDNMADAHSALCENKLYYEWDFAGAERECQRAIELDPNSAMAHQINSHYLVTRGQFDKAISEIKTAIDLEPTSMLNQRIYGTNLYFARRYDEAEAQLKRVASMEPNSGITYPYLWQSLEMQGKYAEAYDWLVKFLTLQKGGEQSVRDFRVAYDASGWQGVLGEQVRQFEGGNYVYFHGAGFNAKAGNKENAFEYLERSYQRREKWMSMLDIDPSLDSLRTDSRFKELIKRVESK